jgi:exosortase/archaeosortase family protein
MNVPGNKNLNDGIDMKRLVLSLVAAGVAVAVLSHLSSLFAVPLREISSIASSMILKAVSFPVTRSGTILMIGEMRFDVVPACSGSNTLQALIGIGIVWCCIQPRLGHGHRIAASLLCVPVALAANSARVAMLAGSSYVSGQMIENGFFHHAIGVISFAVALGVFFLIVRSFPRQGAEGKKVTWPEVSLRISVPLLVFVFMPFLVRCLGDWRGNIYNTLDLHGYVFFFVGMAAFVIYWRRRPADYSFSGPGSALFALGALPVLFTFVRSPNYYVVGVSLLFVLFSLGLVYRGLRFSLSALPLLAIIGFGYPKTTALFINSLGLTGIGSAFCIKSFLTLFLLAATIVSARWAVAAESGPARSKSPFRSVVALTACIFVIQLLNIDIQLCPERIPLSLSYLQQGWVGDDRPIGETEKEFFKDQNVLNRIYSKGDDQVGILVIASSCDRKKIHPPEYCQTGAGWSIEEKGRYAFRKKDGRETEATRLSLFKEETGVERVMVYWFSDGKKTFADYSSFVIDDTLKMLSSGKSEWYLYALWTDQEDAVIENFFSCLDEVNREGAYGPVDGTPPQLTAAGL